MLRVATLAAVLATAGDLLLLHVGTGGDAGAGGLLAGHYLGTLCIPLYALGYRRLGVVLGRASAAGGRWLFALGAYASALGGTVHAFTALAIAAAPPDRRVADPTVVLAPYAAYLAPLWGLLLALGLAVSVLHWRLVRAGGTGLPRWFALVQPASLVVALALAGAMVGPLASYIVPAAPNLAHVVYFGLATQLTAGEDWY